MRSKRFASVDKERCVACGACTQECPRQAISVWRGCFAVVDTALCIGCGKCEAVCPAGSLELRTREN